jgi:ferredoxin-NADP reductase
MGKRLLRGAMLVLILAGATLVNAQVSPEEHARHHPVDSPAGMTDGGGGMGGTGGMGGMMDQMTKQMGAPTQKELYPSLMSLSGLTPEQRAEVQARAHERMTAGTRMFSDGLDALTGALETDDYAAAQGATATMREGLAQFETGLAAGRAIREAKPPADLAIQWFKREMNLLPPAEAETGFLLWGMTLFHTAIMAGLVLFMAAILALYFFKMRRAADLLKSLTGGGAVAPAKVPPSAAPATVPVRGPPTPEGLAPSRAWSGNLRVCQIFHETPNVKTFRLMNPLGGSIPFQHLPGQFLTVTAAPDGKPLKRSYTMACSPTQHDCIEITVKREGMVSEYLHDMVKPGDLLEIAAPFGSFIFTGREAESVVLIGGGVGITPMMSVTRYLTDRSWPGDIFFLYACRNPEDFIFREELEYLRRRHSNLHLTIIVENTEGSDWKGPVGFITKELIARIVPEIATRPVHICAPPGMMESVRKMLAELGVSREQIKTEPFGLAQGREVREPPPEAGAAQVQQDGKKHPLPAVTFTRSKKSAPLPPDESILDVAEDMGVDIDYSCRTGICGTCKVKLLSGEVTMEVEDSLEPEEKAQGIILACQAKSTGNVQVEA